MSYYSNIKQKKQEGINYMKKGFFVMLALTVFLALGLGFSDTADAKRGGGFKSNKQSFTQKKDNTTQQSNSGAAAGTTSGTKSSTGSAATTKSGGLFGGSSCTKGLGFGGLSGLLVGGMLSSMRAFGEIFSLLINIAAIVAIFMIIRAACTYIRNNKPAAAGHNNRNNNYYDQDRKRRDEEDRNGRGQF